MQLDKLLEERKRVAALLQQILEGSLTPEEALNAWPKFEDDPSINSVRHAIEHFIVDEDIRRKDKNYEEHQIIQLKGFMEKLAEGKSISEKEIGWFTPRYVKPSTILKHIWKKIKRV